MNGIKVLAALVGAVTVWSVFAAEWPEPPYTEEKIKRFVNNDELKIASQLYDFSEDNPDNVDVYSKSGLLIQEKVISKNVGIDELSEPSIIERTQNFNERSEEYSAPFYSAYSKLLWNREGDLVGVYPSYISQNDIEYINDLNNLRYLYLSDQRDKSVELDFNQLSSDFPLLGVYVSNVTAKGLRRFCDLKEIEHVEIVESRIVDPLPMSGCSESLRNIMLVESHINNFEISSLSGLKSLGIFGGYLEGLTIDGDTLPNLKTLHITNTDLPDKLDKVKLPSGLVQLYLNYSKDSALSNLVVPDGVEFIDLKFSELDDYSFLSTAKGLEYLRLRGSTFEQWELLSNLGQLEYLDLHAMNITDSDLKHIGKLRNLRYLNLSNTDITDEGLEYISELTNLRFLNLGGTGISNLMPLSNMGSMISLNFYRTNVTDMGLIPYFENIKFLGFALDSHYENESGYTDDIHEMMMNIDFNYICTRHEECGIPAWKVGTR
ncbi:leucine-rich repeat domain-containing protein [Saccharospirillum salsuginis]|nr:hypothetical protein [Saccharospirillum salsuginis]